MNQNLDEALKLVEGFAEARHTCGHPNYNANAAEALQALRNFLAENLKEDNGGMSNMGLTKLMEECGELVQIAAKKVAYPDVDIHPDGQNLNARLIEEMGDVLAAITFVATKIGLDTAAIFVRAEEKKQLYQEWDKGE